MKIINPSFEILDNIDGDAILASIERAGRICYKSEENTTDTSARGFVERRLKTGHESIVEHEKISVKIICDRGVTHEIVRHRVASYSQESTRYCNYSGNKFGNEITVIKPCFWDEKSEEYAIWQKTMEDIESTYIMLINMGTEPQQARSILPNSLKTEIIVTMNLREWRHFFKLRISKAAHPQIREIAIPLLARLKELVPVIFDDINVD